MERWLDGFQGQIGRLYEKGRLLHQAFRKPLNGRVGQHLENGANTIALPDIDFLPFSITNTEDELSDGSGSGWIYYIDESWDKSLFCVTGLGLKISTWRQAFEATREYRKELKDSDSVLLRTEIHATELVRGKGRLGPKTIGKWRRSRIFYDLLELTASLPDVHLINVCLEQADYSDPDGIVRK